MNMIRAALDRCLRQDAAHAAVLCRGERELVARNSASASTSGKRTMVFTSDSLSSMPSKMKLFACGRKPFAESAGTRRSR